MSGIQMVTVDGDCIYLNPVTSVSFWDAMVRIIEALEEMFATTRTSTLGIWGKRHKKLNTRLNTMGI